MKSLAEKKNQRPMPKFMGEQSKAAPRRKKGKKKLKKARFPEGSLAGFLKGFYTVGGKG
jgi:hypothetical protein